MQLGQVAHLGGYVVIIVATLLVNLLAVVALARGQAPVRARLHLILSLTVCNVLLSLTVTLFYAISTGSNQWVFGSGYCFASGSFYMHLNGTIILHLTAIALNSFLYAKHSLPHFKPPSTHKNVFTLVLLWILPAVTSYPPLFGWGEYIYSATTYSCEPHWSTHDNATTSLVVISVFLYFAAPLAILTLCCIRMFTAVQSQFGQRLREINEIRMSTQRSSSEKSTETSTHRLSLTSEEHNCILREIHISKRVVLVIIIIFLLCCAPFFVTALIRACLMDDTVPAVVVIVTMMLPLANSAFNPLIYYFSDCDCSRVAGRVPGRRNQVGMSDILGNGDFLGNGDEEIQQ